MMLHTTTKRGAQVSHWPPTRRQKAAADAAEETGGPSLAVSCETYRPLSVPALALVALVLPLCLVVGALDEIPHASRFTTDTPAESSARHASAERSTGSPFIWQPLPLRATFRPLNRGQTPPPPPSAPAAPVAPRPPRPPRPPSAPEPLALSLSERSISGDQPADNSFSTSSLAASRFTGTSNSDGPFSGSFFQPTPTSPELFPTGSSTTARPAFEPSDEDDELPTRQPMARFRPTRAPSTDEDSNSSGGSGSSANSFSSEAASTSLTNVNTNNNSSSSSSSSSRGSSISQDCFECICEASTNCNSQSRCQTSDVRHTRCGLFLISYDQWLATGLSRELVTREALARDPAADERAFYECVTNRDCAQRLLAIYMERNQKDCDKDGQIDCYDLAAIHHSGMEQCASESLLDSQYWSDFNACLGFGR